MEKLKLGEYVFLSESTATGNYSVWRGFRESDKSAVVAYIFNSELIRTEEMGEKLLRDTHILAQKEHSSIRPPLAAGRKNNRYFIVYPDVGAPLSTFDTSQRIKPREVLSIALQVLRALLFAEDKEIMCHGHICPKNIVFDLDTGEASLMMFGLLPAVTSSDPDAISRFDGYLPSHMMDKHSFASLEEEQESIQDEEHPDESTELPLSEGSTHDSHNDSVPSDDDAESHPTDESGADFAGKFYDLMDKEIADESDDPDLDDSDEETTPVGSDSEERLIDESEDRIEVFEGGSEGMILDETVEEEGWRIGPQTDLFGLGITCLELLVGKNASETLGPVEIEDAEKLSEAVSALDFIPIPVQEVLIRLLSPDMTARYSGYKEATEEVARLLGEDEGRIAFESFIFSTLFGGRFRIGKEIAQSSYARMFKAQDTVNEDKCLVKLIDLREYPVLVEPFKNYLMQMSALDDHTLVKVRDVGVHFELGYIAMDDAGQSLEDLLIRRGMLPLHDAAHIIYQLLNALEFLYFNNISAYGGFKPTNVFLSSNLREARIGDVFLSRFLLEHGNISGTSSEYFSYDWCDRREISRRGDFYSLGLIFFELLVGHPPYSFKVEDEIIQDHISGDTIRIVQDALISSEAKQIIMRLLDRNPGAQYRAPEEIRRDIASMMGWDKREVLELPHIPFDFSDISIVGKNTKEKVEETLCYRLPTKGDRPRGFFTLIHGRGEEMGEAGGAARLVLEEIRESIFTPGQDPQNPANLLTSEPDTYLLNMFERANQEVYRFAFRKGKLKRIGVSVSCGFIQNNTLYFLRNGESSAHFFFKGEYRDMTSLKGAVTDEKIIGSPEKSLDDEPAEMLGFAERFKVQTFKKRLKDGEQVIFLSRTLLEKFSVAEIRELITSQDNPAISIELIEKNARRRRLEGTISAVLVNIGEVTRFVEESAHRTTGNLARSYMESADQLLHDGRTDEAINIYLRAIEHNSNYTTLHYKLGKAFLAKDLKERALGSFLTAIELDSQHIPAHVEAAKIYMILRNYSQAYDLLGRLISRGVEDADIYAHAAMVCNRIRRTKEAAEYCSLALELSPGHAIATRELVDAGKGRWLGF